MLGKRPSAVGPSAGFASMFHKAIDEAKRPKAQGPSGGLNAQQQRALDLAKGGASLFLTGGAGTGKSFTLKRVVTELQARHGEEQVMITASTGIAACHLGGTTVHSFAGVGLAKEKLNELETKVKKNRQCVRRWLECQVLIIDEVSMLDGALFDVLEQLARRLRKDSSPFGGIQLILCGDFFQLPPVGLSNNPKIKFLFESEAWASCVGQQTVLLTEIFRQKESGFTTILNEMRRAKLTDFSISLLRRALACPPDLGLNTTKLFPHNDPAERENERRLQTLDGPIKEWVAFDDEGKPLCRSLRENCIAPTTLQLRVGARVMMLKNGSVDGAPLFNGMTGEVIGFESKPVALGSGVARAPLPNGGVAGGGAAAAASAGPSSSSFDDQFGDGPPEVMARQGEPAYVTEARRRAAMGGAGGGDAQEQYAEYPLVRFANPTGGEPLVRAIEPQEWKLEQGGAVVALRRQVPLKLAWAISIHKSQGMTLDSVELDLARCFDEGHAYVALSRAVSLQQTRIASFDPLKVRANPRVHQFYAALEAAQGGGGDGGHGGAGAQPLRDRGNSGGGGGLTQEQKAMIEKRKAEAMAKRAQAQQQAAGAAPVAR